MKKLLILDLESTCFERGREPPGFFSEIIEIGAVLFNADALQSEWEFDVLIRPALFPDLSDFCRQLTTLRQEDVGGGVSLAEGFQRLREKLINEDYLFSSWGFYDKNQIQKNCERFGIPYPFAPGHVSLKHEFGDWSKKGPMGMGGALRMLKIPLTGTHHRGLDDARNISKIAAWMLRDGWRPKN